MMLSWLRRFTESFAGAPRSSQWPRVRKEHLRRFPTCAACGRSRDIEVHHVVPFHEAPELELDAANLITLCSDPCHFVFGHCMRWGDANKHVREDSLNYLSRVREARSRAT